MTETKTYRLDEESVRNIVRWVLTAQLPKEAYLGSEYIIDVREYVKSSIRDPFYDTAIVRLYRRNL